MPPREPAAIKSPRFTASVVAENLDDARDLSKKLMALPQVAKVESILELVPEGQDKKLPIIKRIVALGEELNVKPPTNKPVDIPKARADVASLLSQAREGLKQAKGYAGISSVAKQAVAAFSEMIPALERADKALNSASVDEIQKRFSASSTGAFSRMQANMVMLKSQKADRGLTLEDIPPQLKKLFVADNGKILLQVYGKQDLWERGPDEDFTKAVLGVAPKATGTPILNYDATELLAHQLSARRRLGFHRDHDPDFPPLPELQVPAAHAHAAGHGRALAHRRDGLVRH